MDGLKVSDIFLSKFGSGRDEVGFGKLEVGEGEGIIT